MGVAQSVESLGTDLTRSQLSVEIAGHVIRLAHVREDETPHVLVALTTSHEAANRDPEPLLETVPSAGPDAVSTDIGVMDRRTEEGNDPAISPCRDQHGDIEQLTGSLVGVVRDQHITGLERLDRDLLEHVRSADGERVDVPRCAGHGLCDHSATSIEDGIREVTGFADDGRERRSLQSPCLLVHRRDQRLPQDLEFDRVEVSCCHDALPSPLVAMRLPSAATSTDQPGRITEVVSRSSTTAGPPKRAPAPRSRRR